MASTQLGDLRSLLDEPAPFATIMINSPSGHVDAAERLDARWRSARRALESDWPAEHIEALDGRVEEFEHDDGESVVLIQSASGATLVAPLMEPVAADVVHIDALPRLATIIEARQRVLPHIVVTADRTGAEIVGFDGGDVVEADEVEGSDLHVHRGHPGGWSQRRFQQRAENVWERNADVVASAVLRLADELEPVLVAVAGDVRARHLVVDAIAPSLDALVVQLEVGDVERIADEVVRLVSDQNARAQRTVIRQLRDGLHDGSSTGFDGIVPALAEARVALLLVDDDDADQPRLEGSPLGGPEGARVVDAAIRAALRSDADIVIVPRVEAMGGPVAALLRWSLPSMQEQKTSSGT